MRTLWSCRRILAAAAIAAWGAVASADGAPFVVTSTNFFGAGSLQEAISLANATTGPDTITFDLPGAGPHLLELPEALPALTGDTEIVNDRPGDEAVELRRSSSTMERFSVLRIDSGNTVLIAGLTLSNGLTGVGGGIYNESSALTVRNCVITGNHAIGPSLGFGGGIYHYGIAPLTVINSVITGNRADFVGGGVSLSTFHETAPSSFINCSITNNEASSHGGGVYNDANTSADLIFDRCTLSGNIADFGGGIYNIGVQRGAKLTMTNCTLSGNIANQTGGGILNIGSETPAAEIGVALINCTLAGNTAVNQPGSGIRNQNAGLVQVRNTIFRGAGIRANISNDVSTFVSLGHNICVDEADGGFGTAPGGLLNGPGDIRNTNAQLGPLQDNGGPTQTHALFFQSPAIDAGDDAVLSAPFNLSTDQRGFPRKAGAHVDMGAYERIPTYVTVTTTADPGDGTCDATECTLREAITAATALEDPTINFAPGVTGTIQLTGMLPNLTKNIEIIGPGADRLTVRRNTGGNYRHFFISNDTESGPFVTISGLTLANGQGQGSGASAGCIFNNFGTLRIRKCALVGNNAGTGGGGAILNFRGTVDVSESTFSGNTTTGSGGVFLNSAAQGPASLTISNCTLSGNSAVRGAALRNAGLTGAGSVMLQASTLAGNSSAESGIYTEGSTSELRLTHSILSTSGGGLNIVKGGSTAVNSLGHNISTDATGGDTDQPGDQRNTDPRLDPNGLQNNGGPTQTIALLSDSPAINTGGGNFALPTDQRGYPRVGASDIGAFEFGGTLPPVPLNSVVSRKVHGTVFDINLPLTGNPGVECRSGGASGVYKLIFSFANPLTSVGNASITSGTGSVSSHTIGSNTHNYIVNLTGVTNAQVIRVRLNNVNDSAGNHSNAVSIFMGILVGDTTGNGSVNSSDIGLTKSKSGQTANSSNFRTDVTVSGSINSSDIGLVKSKSGTALP